MRGASRVIMFTENLTAIRYATILKAGLLPFIKAKVPHSHRFQQDNDPKHRSRYIQIFFTKRKVNWWKTPAESPDLNPIEKVWGSMKSYLRSVHFRKLENRNLEGLKSGIKKF